MTELINQTEPIATQCSLECNHCGNEINPNSIFHPSSNSMHYTCPECGEQDQSSNWLDVKMTIGFDGFPVFIYTSPWDGTIITQDNLREHILEPKPECINCSGSCCNQTKETE